MGSYDHRGYVERAIVIRSRAYCFEGLDPNVKCQKQRYRGQHYTRNVLARRLH